MDSKEFKKIREDSGKSQFEMAIYLGVSQGQISIWERGYRPIPDGIKEKLNEIETE